MGPQPHQPVHLQGLQRSDGLAYASHPSAENKSFDKIFLKFSALFHIRIRMDLDQEAMKQAKMKKIVEKKF